MDPCCGSWIALPPEHVGRGAPAISGGAAFYSFGHFTVFQGLSVQGMLILTCHGFESQVIHNFWSWIRTPQYAIIKFLVTKYPHGNQMWKWV